MDLFGDSFRELGNLLPRDGVVHYHGLILPPDEADQYFSILMQDIAWEHDQAVFFGERIQTARKVAWYADGPYRYTYSRVVRTALPWTPSLRALRECVEASAGERFNACLLNLYHSGEEGMGWHSDGERDLVRGGAIASLSLGAERRFAFKHRGDKEKVSLTLEHGSLLVMRGETQQHWLHRLPPTRKVHAPRINLTFRQMAVAA
jgi:alkylated DNA repair dioxygenase AlkB